MTRLGKYVDAVCATISGLCLVGMIVFNFLDSIGRQISRPVLGAQEVVSFLLCIFFFASIPILVRENAHIRVGLVAETYRGILISIEKYWTILFEVLCTMLLTYMVYNFATRLERIGTLSAHFFVPLFPFIYFAAALMVLAIFFVLERQYHDWQVYRRTGKAAGTPTGQGRL